jgi:Rps23 Pro-64 3,4-dihydroxylase Tpa1-like proline 4-hydroxylase
VDGAKPFKHFCIDNFLEESFAEEALASFPSFEQASQLGRGFATVNERNKIQITDSSKFPTPILRLHEALASQEWLDLMSHVMSIPKLLADPELVGGGIHETGPRGHLDVHVDFNYIKERDLHRRINILVYFNKDWKKEWGGNIELWDTDVKVCHHSFEPRFNRCVVFETSDISYHGVTAVKCPEGVSRKSFAGYYYTKEPPAHWDGQAHSTIFRARPDERLKGSVLMPAEKLSRSVKGTIRAIKDKVKGR